MKRVGILGCTGSIGSSTLKIISSMPEKFCVSFLVANKNETLTQKIAAEHKCPYVLASKSQNISEDILRLIDKTKPDIIVNGISGSAGLLPSKTVLECGVDLALANKESIVMAWHLIKELAEKNDAKIIPVDSEHSAIFNFVNKFGKENIFEIILTASGGPFRTYSCEQLQNVKLADALKHPTWQMGAKITIDSATLANKGLEVIEASLLFDVPSEKIKVYIHPESIVHSLIRTHDKMLYAQASEPDMCHPIFAALTYPHFEECAMPLFDLTGKTLSFFAPDTKKFPMLKIAFDVVSRQSGYAIAYNAANEIAVKNFLEQKISFMQIPNIVETVMQNDWGALPQTFSDVFDIDQTARQKTIEILKEQK